MTPIGVNISSGNGFVPDGTKPLRKPMLIWLSVRSGGIYLKALSGDDLKIAISKTRWKIASLKWHQDLHDTNEFAIMHCHQLVKLKTMYWHHSMHIYHISSTWYPPSLFFLLNGTKHSKNTTNFMESRKDISTYHAIISWNLLQNVVLLAPLIPWQHNVLHQLSGLDYFTTNTLAWFF